MNMPPKLRKTFRLLLAFLIVYIVWSIIVNLSNLDHGVDDEAIVPCLFFLPPAGILVIGIVLVKVLESAIFLRLIKRLFRKKK